MSNGPIRVRDVVIVVLLPFIAIALIVVPVWLASRWTHDSLHISCQLIEANIHELQTLELIATELGLPTNIDIPEMPAICADIS